MFNKSPRNIDARRLLWRKCPISRPVKAARRGPHWPVGTPSGRAAVVVMPQQGHCPRNSWYSSTIGSIGGNPQTWCRCGASELCSNSPPQRRHASGKHSVTLVHCSTGTNSRRCRLWPFCPPRFRFLPTPDFRFGFAWGCFEPGGTDEFRGVNFSTFPSIAAIRY